MRDLASIQVIGDIRPIPNADAIECATILGWHVVVKKGEFRVGDSVVYVEIDSILPERAEFEFMRPRRFRVKTIKLRGQVSQGICFPLDILPSGIYAVGDDVTEALGIYKWEPETDEDGNVKQEKRSTFPEFIPKTDETRVQSIPSILEKYGDIPFYATEKLDGSSITVFRYNGEFGVATRNHIIKDPAEGNKYWEAVLRLDIPACVPEGYAWQGELVGPGIQGNKYKLNNKMIFWFNVYDIVNQKYLSFQEAYDMVTGCECSDNRVFVPIRELGISLKDHTVDSLVDLVSDKKSVVCKDTPVEGYVFRPLQEIQDYDFRGVANNRISFKVINPNFLLKYDV